MIKLIQGISHIGERNRTVTMILLPHIFFLIIYIYAVSLSFPMDSRDWIVVSCRLILILLHIVVALYLHIMPVSKSQFSSRRLRILYGGRQILRICFFGILSQLIVYPVLFHLPVPDPNLPDAEGLMVGFAIFSVFDIIYVILYFYLLLLNGSLRVLCTCRSLGTLRRILVFTGLMTPIVNLFVLKYICGKAKEEYDRELCRFENRKERDGSLICATKYPIIMLHGIGFRDLKYFNYWGRIPKELARNGAIVYYGHQEAWGTIEDNAMVIRDKIKEVLEENHCEKVNIIAHSKGGLDARYVISTLHMENQVASLTTISTPHQGSELIDLLSLLPDSLYRKISSLFDKSYGKFGDKHPDCYRASKQLSPSYCQHFNEVCPNSPEVYYQSYASQMKGFTSDWILSIPHLMMRLAGVPQNDGLVSVTSAKWGEFRETFVSTSGHGVSHGDMIDLKREDHRGFDVIEAYVKMVAELKDKGY